MKQVHFVIIVTILIVILAIPFQGAADMVFSGEVVIREESRVVSPYGGQVSRIYFEEGELVSPSDVFAMLSTEKHYALTEGTISGVFVQEGDPVAEIVDRYGAILYIEPKNKFTLQCNIEKAHSASENRYVHIGEHVYISCTRDGSHVGEGIITSIDSKDDNIYTVEICNGMFYLNETVNIFRMPDYSSTSKIGRGTVKRAKSIAVNGKGSILKMYVSSGDWVQRGDLLFETVPDIFDCYAAIGPEIYCPTSGIISSIDVTEGDVIEKGTTLARILPREKMQIQIMISEFDTQYIFEGDKVLIEFNISGRKYPGNISSISYVSSKSNASNAPNYLAYIDFEADESIRAGMTVLVHAN